MLFLPVLSHAPAPVRVGAGLRELMDRMGHSTPTAALIYQHGSKERRQAIAADALSQLVTDAMKLHPVGRSDTQHAQ